MNKDYIKCIDVFKIVNIGVIYKTKYYFFSQTCSKKENLKCMALWWSLASKQAWSALGDL